MKLVIATRLHLGRASEPPSTEKIRGWIRNLQSMLESVDIAEKAIIAVDATPKLDNYDYVQAIRDQITSTSLEVLPVAPWGKFVPALNALVVRAVEFDADQIMFVSAEVSASSSSIQELSKHCNDATVLVAGAALPGHVYQHSPENATSDHATPLAPTIVELTGRTTPWNTLAVWNLSKLKLTGFLMVSDTVGASSGVEECVAIAASQKLFSSSQSRAKLVHLSDVSWEETFDDVERRKWHEQKMKSKVERPALQLKLMQLSGATVEHC